MYIVAFSNCSIHDRPKTLDACNFVIMSYWMVDIKTEYRIPTKSLLSKFCVPSPLRFLGCYCMVWYGMVFLSVRDSQKIFFEWDFVFKRWFSGRGTFCYLFSTFPCYVFPALVLCSFQLWVSWCSEECSSLIWWKISQGKTWMDFCYVCELSNLPERCGKMLRQPLEAVGAGSVSRSTHRDGRSSGKEWGLGHFFHSVAQCC